MTSGSLLRSGDLVTTMGIAERFGVTRTAVQKWQARGLDFPKPVRTDPVGRQWFSWSAVRAWGENTGRWDYVSDMPIYLTPGAVSHMGVKRAAAS